MTILEILDGARALLEQDGWDDGDIAYNDLLLVMERLRLQHPSVANEEMYSDETGATPMNVKYYVDPKGSHMIFDMTAETVKELFRKIAEAQEVFEELTKGCGMCKQSANIQCRVRNVDGNEFFELVCMECQGTLSLGQTKDGTRLYPKRKGRPENRGWEPEYKEAAGARR